MKKGGHASAATVRFLLDKALSLLLTSIADVCHVKDIIAIRIQKLPKFDNIISLLVVGQESTYLIASPMTTEETGMRTADERMSSFMKVHIF